MANIPSVLGPAILRLYHDGYSQMEIKNVLQCSKSIVAQYIADYNFCNGIDLNPERNAARRRAM